MISTAINQCSDHLLLKYSATMPKLRRSFSDGLGTATPLEAMIVLELAMVSEVPMVFQASVASGAATVSEAVLFSEAVVISHQLRKYE